MTEPDHPGSNPVWMGTRAVRDGDAYVIDGRKWFASGADGARFAIVMAVTDPDAEPHRRASLLIVPAETPGFRRVRNIPCMGHAGDDWASHAELAFESCRVPLENRLGEEGAGFAMAQARLGPGRIHHAMRWIGVCRRAFDLMCDRAARRELAPGDPLGSRQAVQEWIAESRGVDRGRPAAGPARGLDDRRAGRRGGTRGHLAGQVPRRWRHAARGRPRHPGPRGPGDQRRHRAVLVLSPGACGPDLRRARRGPQGRRRPPDPQTPRASVR